MRIRRKIRASSPFLSVENLLRKALNFLLVKLIASNKTSPTDLLSFSSPSLLDTLGTLDTLFSTFCTRSFHTLAMSSEMKITAQQVKQPAAIQAVKTTGLFSSRLPNRKTASRQANPKQITCILSVNGSCNERSDE